MPLRKPVTQAFLRRFCDEQGIWSVLRHPEVSRVLVWEGAPRHLPPGSRSQLWELQTPGSELIARVHFYRGPQGDKLGRPDPKYVRWGRFIFYPGEDP